MGKYKSDYKPLNSPLRWVGGKSRLRKHILPLIPNHGCFVDLFSGAGWVLFGKAPSRVEVLNDIDQELINFFRVVRDKRDEFIASFDRELVSRAEFTRLAELDINSLSQVERAHRFYYIVMAGWGGELAYPRFQTSIRDGGHGNRLFGAIKHLRQRVDPIRERLSTVIIENLPWQDCLKRYDSPETVFYVDPPYPGNKCNYAHNMKESDLHRELYNNLDVTQGGWILSSYDNDEIRRTFDHERYKIYPIESYSGMKIAKDNQGRVKNREVLILNFTPSIDHLHMAGIATEPQSHGGHIDTAAPIPYNAIG